MKNFETSCCFTGYRPEKFPFEFETKCPEFYEFCTRFYTIVSRLIVDGCHTFYCGMAHGFDIFAGEYIALIKQRNTALKLIGVVPFNGQEKGWSDEWKQRYHTLLSQCDEVVVLNESYTPWSFNQRNRYMVDRCRHVLTYFDGQKGGTANTVKYAAKHGREILNIYETDPFAETMAKFNTNLFLIPPEEEN